MKLKEYIKALQQVVDEDPLAEDLVVVYASDEEGNNFKLLDSVGTFAYSDNLQTTDVDLEGVDSAAEANCIIIN